MGLRDRLRRNNQSVLPDEVNQYYQSEQRERAGVAVVLGLLALIFTVALAAGLFFGGRWAYRQIKGDDNQTTQQVATEDQNKAVEEEKKKQEEEQKKKDEEQKKKEEEQRRQAEQSAPAPATQTPAPAPSPSLGDSNLPRTGDEGM